MKKLLLVILFLLSSLTALAVRYVVDTKDGYANLREKASTNSKIKNRIDNSYDIINFDTMKEKDWYYVKIERDGNYSEIGYIHKSQLGIHPETYVTSSKDGYINVRSKPSTSSKILAELPNDAYVTRHPKKTVGDWYYVDFGPLSIDSVLEQGYIHKSQLKKFK